MKWIHVSFIVVVFFMFGCQTSQVMLPESVQQQVDRVHEIDAVSLDDLSESKPLSLDEDANSIESPIAISQEYAESVVLDIAEVRSSALANNLDLQVELYTSTIAGEETNIERAKFESVFNGGLSYSDSNSPTASGLSGTQSDYLNAQVGVRKFLPTGGSVSLDVPFNRLNTDNPYSLLNPAYESDMRFTIEQPLLRGAGFETNKHSIRVAELQKQRADAGTKLEAIRVLANAEKAYWQVYAASHELGIRLQQYQLAEQQVREAKIRVKALVSPQIEITRAESGLASRLESIIVAKTLLRYQERNLKRIINHPDIPMQAGTVIIPKTLPNPMRIDANPNQIAQMALDNRMDMLELELLLAQDESTVNFAQNARLPLFLLDYTYNINGLGSDFGQSFEQVVENDYSDWQAGFRFEIPIGNQAARARLKQAVMIRNQRLATKEQRAQQITKEVYDVLDQLEQNWQRIHAAQRDKLFAERTYYAEKRQFDLGQRTSTDVLYAAERLAVAQSRENQAIADYQITLVDVAFATGTLLGHSNVMWEAKPSEQNIPQDYLSILR